MSKTQHIQTRKLQTDKDQNHIIILTVGYLWLTNRNPGFSSRTVGKAFTKQNALSCLFILTKYVNLHKSNSQNQSRQLMRPMWRVETMVVLPVQNGSRKTCLQIKGGKISSSIDTKLKVSKETNRYPFDWKQCQQTVPNHIHVLMKKWHLIKPRQSLQRQIF